MISVKRKMKTCFVLILVFVLTALPMAAQETVISFDGSDFFPPMTKQERLENTIYLQNLNYAAACDGVLTVINPQDKKVMPVINDGKFYVPLRFVLEYYGVDVSWEHETKTVVMTAGEKQFRLSVSDGVFSLGEKSKQLDNSCYIDRGTTFVAFEDISKIIYCDTYYYPENKAGVISAGPSWKPDEQAEKQAVGAMEFAISPFFKMFI